MDVINSYLFWVVTLILLIYTRMIVKARLLKTIYFSHYFFTFLIFYGPLLYYKLGFRGYAITATSNASIKIYMGINIFIYLTNMIYLYFMERRPKYIFSHFFRSIKINEKKRSILLKFYFFLIFILVLSYIIIYRNQFPIFNLLTTGKLGERPDTFNIIPFYITVSSLFITIIPSGFFYFFYYSKNDLNRIIALIVTFIIMIASGHKGAISFFLLFFFYYTQKKFNLLRIIILVFVLASIYIITKGITHIDKNTIFYLFESPFRRVFAAQGVGFIARIKMMTEGTIDPNSAIEIKTQVFRQIYRTMTGSSPTMFLGDILVKYGYFIMVMVYILYLTILLPIVNTVDKIFHGKKDLYVMWNFFMIIYIFSLSNISIANTIRIAYLIMNIILINFLLRIKTNE